MITDNNISKVVKLLQDRQVNLYHACQFQDFEAYLEIEGIPSRKKLGETRQSYTPFETDDDDRINGVCDKVLSI